MLIILFEKPNKANYSLGLIKYNGKQPRLVEFTENLEISEIPCL